VLAEKNAGVWPSFLSDGRHFVFFHPGADDSRGVYLGSLDSKDSQFLLRSDFKGAFVEPGFLLFIRGDALLAQRFDVKRFQLTGEPAVLAEGVWRFAGAAQASFSASRSGVLAYVNESLKNTQLTTFDRSGRSLGAVGDAGGYGGESPRIAPNGSQVAIGHNPGGEILVMRLADATATRLTLEPRATTPIWSVDGSRVLFAWSRGPRDIAVSIKDASGAGAATTIAAIGTGHLWDWSPDGRWIVFGAEGPERAADLWLLPVGTPAQPTPFAPSRFHKTEAQIAPNGRWLAYTSYESGRDEVYVDSFPSPGDRRQVSTAGGMQPRWRRDGTEMFYLARDQTLMAVPVTTTGARLDMGRATPLFRTRIVPQGSQSVWFDTMYDVSPDGQRIIINGPPNDPGPPITVVLNWQAALAARERR
jgi:hypothetical protein